MAESTAYGGRFSGRVPHLTAAQVRDEALQD